MTVPAIVPAAGTLGAFLVFLVPSGNCREANKIADHSRFSGFRFSAFPD